MTGPPHTDDVRKEKKETITQKRKGEREDKRKIKRREGNKRGILKVDRKKERKSVIFFENLLCITFFPTSLKKYKIQVVGSQIMPPYSDSKHLIHIH